MLHSQKDLPFLDQNLDLTILFNNMMGLVPFLGMEDCLSGKSALFINNSNLVIELKESMSANQLNGYKRRFGKSDSVVLDELGYAPFDQIGARYYLIFSRIGRLSV